MAEQEQATVGVEVPEEAGIIRYRAAEETAMVPAAPGRWVTYDQHLTYLNAQKRATLTALEAARDALDVWELSSKEGDEKVRTKLFETAPIVRAAVASLADDYAATVGAIRTEEREKVLGEVREKLEALKSLVAECVMRGAEAGDRKYRAQSNSTREVEAARRDAYSDLGDRLRPILGALASLPLDAMEEPPVCQNCCESKPNVVTLPDWPAGTGPCELCLDCIGRMLDERRKEIGAALASQCQPPDSLDRGGEADWMKTSLATVLRHFESEANSADELILRTDADAMCGRYEVPWRRRYEIERDTYRYVLKCIAESACTDQPAPKEEEDSDV